MIYSYSDKYRHKFCDISLIKNLSRNAKIWKSSVIKGIFLKKWDWSDLMS